MAGSVHLFQESVCLGDTPKHKSDSQVKEHRFVRARFQLLFMHATMQGEQAPIKHEAPHSFTKDRKEIDMHTAACPENNT